MDFEFWQRFHNLHCLKTDCNDLQEEIQWISFVALLDSVFVEIVNDAGILVNAHSGALNDPVKSRFLVDDVLLSF